MDIDTKPNLTQSEFDAHLGSSGRSLIVESRPAARANKLPQVLQAGPNGYPIPDPNPKFLSIPEPDPIFFQNHRVFRVSGIPENFNFCINLMCRLFKF